MTTPPALSKPRSRPLEAPEFNRSRSAQAVELATPAQAGTALSPLLPPQPRAVVTAADIDDEIIEEIARDGLADGRAGFLAVLAAVAVGTAAVPQGGVVVVAYSAAYVALWALVLRRLLARERERGERLGMTPGLARRLQAAGFRTPAMYATFAILPLPSSIALPAMVRAYRKALERVRNEEQASLSSSSSSLTSLPPSTT